MLDERIEETGAKVPDDVRERLVSIFDKHDTFSQSRQVERASVKLRFRVMTEASSEGNILQYPQINDNTLSFLLPIEKGKDKDKYHNLTELAFKDLDLHEHLKKVRSFEIKHVLNGPFQVFQFDLE